MALPPKVCPECQEEYVHTTEVCVSCDVPWILEGEQVEEDAAPELPPISELVCIRSAPLSWATALTGRLTGAGIGARLSEAVGDGAEGE